MSFRAGRVVAVSVLLVLVVSAALGFTWWTHTGSALSESPGAAPATSTTQADPGNKNEKQTESAAVAMSRSARHPSVPSSSDGSGHRAKGLLPHGSGPQALADLERRANSGDMLAMAQLGRIFRMCPYRERYQNAQLSGVVEATLSEFGDDPEFEGVNKKSRQTHRRRFGEAVGQLCADFQIMDEKLAAKTFWYWLQRAADAGDTTAMVNYAGNVVRTWPDVEGDDLRGGQAPLAHIEEIERYRQRAVGYLQTARDKGDPSALIILSQQYAAGSLFQLDLVKSCAYILAFRSTSAMESPINRRSSWFLLSQLQNELDPAQFTRARVMAKDIEANFVEQIRVGP